MRYPRPTRRQRRKLISLSTSCLLFLCMVPVVPFSPSSHASPRAPQPMMQDDNIVNIAPGSAYRQTNLISDVPGLAPVLDPLMVNPWGITVRGTSPFWVANNGTSTTQLIKGDVSGAPVVLNASPQTVNIPGGLPTGVVANSTSDFQIPPPGGGALAASNFISASITGNLTAWNGAQGSTGKNVAAMPGHVWTGLAIGVNGSGNRLYAADF